MNKILLFLCSSLISLIFSNTKVLADIPVSKPVFEQIESKQLDEDAKILAEYFALHNSPLEVHAQDFIDAAKKYDLDWKLVPAIAGVESTFGKQIPGGYNAWGWGVYGTQAIYFDSWKNGIYTVSKGLRENYLNKGLLNPYQMNRIYAASPFWGNKVAYFMKDMEEFSQKIQKENELVDINVPAVKIAAVSGQLNLR